MSRPTWRRRFSRPAVAALLITWIAAGATDAVDGAGGPEAGPTARRVLEVGYSSELLPRVDLDDARAATSAWISHLVEKTRVQASTDVRYYDEAAAILRSLEARTADLLVLSPLQYLEIRATPLLRPIFISSLDGHVGKCYVLLSRQDSGIDALGALRSKRILIHQSGLGTVSQVWLGTSLLRRGLPEGAAFFASQEVVERASAAVLPVLFRQADACLIALHEYEAMCQLNPQLGADLREIGRSPRFARGPICLRPELYEELSSVFDESILSLHADPRGRQMLALFGVDRVVPFEPHYLESLVSLVEEYAQLRASGVRPR